MILVFVKPVTVSFSDFLFSSNVLLNPKVIKADVLVGLAENILLSKTEYVICLTLTVPVSKVAVVS